MKIKYSILFLFLISNVWNIFSQTDLISDDKIKRELFDKWGENTKNKEISVFPIYKVLVTPDEKHVETVLDSGNFIVRLKNDKYLNFYSYGKKDSKFGNSKKIEITQSMLEKISTFCKKENSFIYFDNDQVLLDYTKVSVFNLNEGVYINSDLKIFKNIQDFLSYRYGSMEKYFEISKLKKEKLKFNSKPVDEIKNLAKNNYLVWQELFPNDTTKIVDLFVKDVDYCIELNDSEKRLLKQEIMYRISYTDANDANGIGIPMFKEDITLFVRRALPKRKFYKYLDCKYDFNKKRVIDNVLKYEYNKSHKKTFKTYNDYLKSILKTKK